MGLPSTLDPSNDFGLPYSNYAPVADPTTDLSASSFENLAIAAAALTHTAPRAWAVVSGAATTAGVMLVDHAAMWGDTNAVKPTVARVSTGAYTLTWASAYPDLNPTPARQVTAAVSLRTATLQMHEQGRGIVTVSGNVATVSTFANTTTAANKRFTVWVY